jgi:hypothetical protein
MRVSCLTILLFGAINLHAQTDSLAFFMKLNANPILEAIDSLLGISNTNPVSGIEYRKYRQVEKMDDPKYLFECNVIRWEEQAWVTRVYGIVYTSSKSAPIYRYQKEFKVAKGIDSLKTAIEKAIVSKPQKENFTGYLGYPPAIYYYHDGIANLLVPQIATATYTKNPAIRITRLTYNRYSKLEQLLNRMIIR